MGRVANQGGRAVVTSDTDVGRVAAQNGRALVAPVPEFRVANMFVEVFVELRQAEAPPFDEIQGGAIRRGLGVGRLGQRRR